MRFRHIIPKTVGIRELLREYKDVHAQLQNEEMLMVMNQSKPEMVLLSLDAYEELRNKAEDFENLETVQAFKQYLKSKKQDKLINLHSLADVMNDKN